MSPGGGNLTRGNPGGGLLLLAGLVWLLATPAPARAQVRVPAEWEPQEAVWLQWPDQYEAALRPVMADLVRVIQAHEPVHLLTRDQAEMGRARRYLEDRKTPVSGLTWHILPLDNAWMRDNGPVYVISGSGTRVQNWGFDAWGGNFGPQVGWTDDDRVPDYVGGYLGLAVEARRGYVLERGNLESDGAGLVVLNWDCQQDRNPGLSQADQEALLKQALGAERIIWAQGHDPEDPTTGHIDGLARFVAPGKIVVADTGWAVEQALAAACKSAGLEVIRYPGDVNWLIGNGFVAAASAGDPALDADLKTRLEALFQGRQVHLLDAGPVARAGGGLHCLTNDQPRIR